MRIIIAGSRSFADYDLLDRKMNLFVRKAKAVIVLSGHAKGADLLGEKWAFLRGFMYEIYRPDYGKHGKKAPLLRNEEMARNATHLAAFWDGISPGTRDMIERAKRHKLKIRIVLFDKGKP